MSTLNNPYNRRTPLDYQSDFSMKTMETLFENDWIYDICTYYLTFNLLSAQIRKLSKYPIQDFIFTGGQKTNDFYSNFFKDVLDMGASGHTLEEIGIEVLGYGNSYISFYQPFIRRFKCNKCGKASSTKSVFGPKSSITKITEKYVFGVCPKCKQNSKLKVSDEQVAQKMEDCSLVRWPVKQIKIKYITYSGKRIYYYTLSSFEKKKIKNDKDLDYISAAPWEIIYAAWNDKKVRFHNDKIFHMRGPSINGLNLAHGLPLILPAILSSLHIQQLRKANDVAAADRTKAHDIVFPSAENGINPARSMNMGKWTSFMSGEIDEHRGDPARKTFSPIPLGKISLGGDAKALLLHNEINQCLTEVAMSLGMPSEWLFGGGHYSGSVVSHRFVEMFLSAIQSDYIKLGSWIIKKMQQDYETPITTVSMKKFKMADDMELYQIYTQLYQMGILDPESLYDKTGLGEWKDIKNKLKIFSEFQASQNKNEMKGQLDMSVIEQLINQKLQGLTRPLGEEYRGDYERQEMDPNAMQDPNMMQGSNMTQEIPLSEIPQSNIPLNYDSDLGSENYYSTGDITQMMNSGMDAESITKYQKQGLPFDEALKKYEMEQKYNNKMMNNQINGMVNMNNNGQNGKTSLVIHRTEHSDDAPENTLSDIILKKQLSEQINNNDNNNIAPVQPAQPMEPMKYVAPVQQTNTSNIDINKIINVLSTMDENEKNDLLSKLSVNNPSLYTDVINLMGE